MNAYDMDALPTPAMIPAMKSAGIKAVIIYSRLVTREIVELLSANDIDAVLVAEWGSGANPSHYTTENGTTDATMFLKEMNETGLKPPGVYFCNGDFDASDEQIANGITDYRRAVKAVLDPEGIGAGGYGNGANMKAGLDDSTIVKAFVWAGRGTNGTVEFDATDRWSIRQYPTTKEFGASVDPDEVQGDYWGFRVPTAMPAVATPSSSAPRPTIYLGATGSVVSALQIALDISADGDFGPQTQRAVIAFQQAHRLTADGIVGPQTWAALGL